MNNVCKQLTERNLIMLSKNQTTQVGLDVNGSFTRSASERLKESQRRQNLVDADRNKQDLKLVGGGVVAVIIALLAGLAM